MYRIDLMVIWIIPDSSQHGAAVSAPVAMLALNITHTMMGALGRMKTWWNDANLAT